MPLNNTLPYTLDIPIFCQYTTKKFHSRVESRLQMGARQLLRAARPCHFPPPPRAPAISRVPILVLFFAVWVMWTYIYLLALDRSKPAKVALTVAINILGVRRAVAPVRHGVSKDLEGAAALDKLTQTTQSQSDRRRKTDERRERWLWPRWAEANGVQAHGRVWETYPIMTERSRVAHFLSFRQF